MLVASDATYDDRPVYSYETICLRNDPTGSLDQLNHHLRTELIDNSLPSFTSKIGDNKDEHTDDCSTQIINAVDDFELIANELSGYAGLNDFIMVSFSKILHSLFHPSSIVVLISIVVTGLVLNFLKKLKKSTNRNRKGFSQGTRKRILIKQNYRCVYC